MAILQEIIQAIHCSWKYPLPPSKMRSTYPLLSTGVGFGHAAVLHSFVSLGGPSSLQFFPPFSGLGFVHSRVLSCLPPPQDTEHSENLVHSE